ncbi:hypothetical protein FVEG_07673 [Fusarium verticillioides 7600]|uniref:CSC1/OSCA1-like 7TM region domain-containing protein n=1 Tax=Gibberella moniliformis (strain M3125 / FGSC 7600) TaxID=334819 RepID=W7MIX3_GIBM7|nr:hypothetical protein FVEG_07673 [Fusarium verticillioides 7600]EWG47609.1 hypothetical protein FVEG_07673 [Fusarium verticillioides 7600]
MRQEDSVEGNDTRVGQVREGVGAQRGTLKADLPALLSGPVGPLVLAAGPTIIYTILFLVLFFILRRRIPRIYSPKSINPLYRSSLFGLPTGWISSFRAPDSYIIARCSLDGFLFLRYLRVLSLICFIGIVLTWPVILPIHARGSEWPLLNSLTILNLKNHDQLYAHVVISWIFTGFVLYIVWREHLYYINLRHFYLSKSGYYERRTSRTILITSIPEHCLNEKVFQKLFGHSLVQCSIPQALRRLRKLVKKREKRARQLQEEEVVLINEYNRGRPSRIRPILPSLNWMRRTRSSEPDVEKVGFFQRRAPKTKDVDIQVSSHESSNLAFEPPSPEPGKIKSTRSDLHLLNQQIDKLRQQYQAGQGKHLNTAFIEFDSFASAQAAFQSIPQHQPLQMCRQVMGVKPGEIVWSSLRIKWWERLLREFVVTIVIGGCVIVWIMPITLVVSVTSAPMVGRVDGVSELPQLAVNAISGLGRALLLWILLEFVPLLMRICAKFAGVTTLTGIEHFVHKRYFIFQTLQIFIGPMLRSSPITYFSDMTFLQQQVPEVSILYMSYILVRCLSAGATELIQLWQLFINMVRRGRPGTPRTTYEKFYELNVVHWGSVYPVMTTIGVIAITYACIAPLVLVFALTGLGFVYFVYKYTLVHIYDTETLDTTGRFYPRAMMHIMLGLYLAQAYLTLVFLRYGAWVQFSLLVLLAVFTVFIHLSLRKAMNPCIDNFSTLDHDGASKRFHQGENIAARGVDQYGSSSSVATSTETMRDLPPSTFNKRFWSTQQKAKHRMCGSWFRISAFGDFQNEVSPNHTEDEFMALYGSSCYQPPETWLPKPKLWLPEDGAIGNCLEVLDIEEPLPISHDGAQLDEKGRVKFDLELAPFHDDLLFYRHLHYIL